MSDVQLLFIVLAALYFWECACWLRRGQVGFSTWLGRRWRALHPGTIIANQAGGFVLASPLPPLGTLFVTNQFPLSITEKGVLAFVATNLNPGPRPAQSGRFVAFEEIREIRTQGRKVLVNGELLVTCSSATFARHCTEELRRLAKLNTTERARALAENPRRLFDVKALEHRWQEFKSQVTFVRSLSNGLLAYVFVLVPVVIVNFGFRMSWLGLLIGLLILSGATAFSFSRAFRNLYPKAEDEHFTHTLTILLAPTTAMRAHDALSRPLLENFHPLAAAKCFLSEVEFRQFARRVLLDQRHPALPSCANENPAAQETELAARRALLTETEKFLKRSGLTPDELCKPPEPTDASCRTFCPRCEAQFTAAATHCADCGGLPLIAFANDPAKL